MANPEPASFHVREKHNTCNWDPNKYFLFNKCHIEFIMYFLNLKILYNVIYFSHRNGGMLQYKRTQFADSVGSQLCVCAFDACV